MPLPKLRVVDDAIPNVHDDPDFRQAAAIAAAFRDRITFLERSRMRLDIEAVFARRAPRQDSPSDQDLWRRLLDLRQEQATAAPPAPAADTSPSPAIKAGHDVLAGRPIQAPADHAAQLVEIDRQIDVLTVALAEQETIVSEIADRLVHQYALKLAPAWNAHVLQMYRAAQALAQTTAAFREFRAALTNAGIRGASTVLRAPNVRTPLLLGDESDWHSEVSQWRRILESWGLLP